MPVRFPVGEEAQIVYMKLGCSELINKVKLGANLILDQPRAISLIGHQKIDVTKINYYVTWSERVDFVANLGTGLFASRFHQTTSYWCNFKVEVLRQNWSNQLLLTLKTNRVLEFSK